MEIPQEIITLMASEAKCIKEYWEHESPVDLLKARRIREEIRSRYWVSFNLEAVK